MRFLYKITQISQLLVLVLLVKYISVLQKQWIKPFLQAQIAAMSTTDFIADPTWRVFMSRQTMIMTTDYCEVLYCWPHEKDLWGNTALYCVTHTTHQHCYVIHVSCACRNYSTSTVLCSVTRLQEHKRIMEFVWTTTVSQTAWLLGNWSSLVGSHHRGNMFSSLINLLHMICLHIELQL